jgi:biopolymer transport protein ExbD
MTDQNNEESPQGFDKQEEEWIKEQRARDQRRKTRSKGRGDEGEGDVNINSLMDIMVIILVFLLKSFGDQPVKVTGSDLDVPKSSTELSPEDMTTVTVSRSKLLVNDEAVTDVPLDKSQKRGGDSGLEIIALLDRLNTVLEKKKQEMKLLGQEYKPVVTIIADQTTPYRLLTEVMYTAGQAGLSKFKFAVVKGDRSSVAPVSSL